MVFLKILLIIVIVAEVLGLAALAFAWWWLHKTRRNVKRAIHWLQINIPLWRQAITTGALSWEHVRSGLQAAGNFMPWWAKGTCSLFGWLLAFRR